MISRDELVEHLAQVSHKSWMSHVKRDKRLENPPTEVTDHDRERAEDIVAELERLGIYEAPS
jgi:hypothetical protein